MPSWKTNVHDFLTNGGHEHVRRAGKRNANVLARLRINEVSSVDRGAGENVKSMLMKRDEESRRSKPMNERVNKFFADIFNGIPSGNVELNRATTALAKSVARIETESDPKERAGLLAKTFEQFHNYIAKLSVPLVMDNRRKGDEDMQLSVFAKALGLKEDASEKDVLEKVSAMNKAAMDAAEAIEKAKAKFTDDEDKEDDDEKDPDKKKAFRAMTHEQRKDYMFKKRNSGLSPEIQAILKQAAEDRKRIEKLEGERSLESIKKACADASIGEDQAEVIQKAYAGDHASVDALVGLLKAANNQAKAAGVFKEVGSTGGDRHGTSAMDQLNSLAAELRKSQPALSQDQAFAKVYADPKNKKLVQAERLENSPRAA